jgi:hypothetical protein
MHDAGGQRLAGRGLAELGVLAVVYVGYALSRVLADASFGPARGRAEWLLDVERTVGLDVEQPLNQWLVEHDLLGTLAAFQYAAAHYVVTLAVLVWLLLRRPAAYVPARRALVLATFVALLAYLALPTAPPRLLDGWTDLMALHADVGWWGEAASAPQGMGWLTNQLAAFPSMHAGWALWVALAVQSATRSRAAVALGWAHAVVTAVVVVGTANHWLLDVAAGWAVVGVAWWLVRVTRSRSAPDWSEVVTAPPPREAAAVTGARTTAEQPVPVDDGRAPAPARSLTSA